MKFTSEELFELTSLGGGRFKAGNTDEAYSFCEKLARSHYENFPVASILIPAAPRRHIFSVYAFARIADDIADELIEINKAERLTMLDEMEKFMFNNNYSIQNSGNPIYLALDTTIKKLQIPSLPFQKLLSAFRRDINFKQPETFADLEDYCQYSANPIGELVLRIFGLYNEKTAYPSDNICTGLQLVNFWQDISLDLKNNRLYIPKNLLEKYKLNEENLHDEKFSAKLRISLDEIYDYTEKFFITGKELIPCLKPLRLQLEIAATIEGGKMILNKLRALGVEVFRNRPRINHGDIIPVFFRSILYCKIFSKWTQSVK